VDVLATELAAALLLHEECPEYLHQARFADAVGAWAFTVAVAWLPRSWLAAQDIETALAENTTALEETTHSSGRSRKRTSGQRVQSALDALHRAETRANNLRQELGLTPAAVARMGLDIGVKKDTLMHSSGLSILCRYLTLKKCRGEPTGVEHIQVCASSRSAVAGSAACQILWCIWNASSKMSRSTPRPRMRASVFGIDWILLPLANFISP
jgi:hypothetical protein